MSECDGCGEETGHADETTVVYDEDAVDMETPEWDDNRAVFGASECREIFEDHHDISEEDIVEVS